MPMLRAFDLAVSLDEASSCTPLRLVRKKSLCKCRPAKSNRDFPFRYESWFLVVTRHNKCASYPHPKPSHCCCCWCVCVWWGVCTGACLRACVTACVRARARVCVTVRSNMGPYSRKRNAEPKKMLIQPSMSWWRLHWGESVLSTTDVTQPQWRHVSAAWRKPCPPYHDVEQKPFTVIIVIVVIIRGWSAWNSDMLRVKL